MYLLDTNHCSSLMGGDPKVQARLLEKGLAPVSICIFVQAELYFMAYHSQQQAVNLSRVHSFCAGIHVYGVDAQTAQVYGHLKAEILRRFGPQEKSKRRRTKIEHLGISENDLWIAAVAVQHGLTVVSADGDFQRLREAQPFALENWLSSVG